MTRRRITIACPVRDEEELTPLLVARSLAVLDGIAGGPHELLVVDDGSCDRTLELLEDAAAHDPRVTVVSLSRSFGHQAAMSAAIDHASGDAVLLMDGDLQDPPEALPQLLERMDSGFDVVFVRRTNRKEPWHVRLLAFLAYRVIAALARPPLPLDAGDFALLSRRAVDAMRGLPERHRYLRGLRSWVGYEQSAIDYARAERAGGRRKYNLRSSLTLALDGVFAFSTAPLRLIGVLGGLTLLLSVTFAIYAVIAKIVLNRSAAGFTALTVLGTMIGGMLLLSLWIIGEYIGRIYEEVKGRPIYVVHHVTTGRAPPRN